MLSSSRSWVSRSSATNSWRCSWRAYTTPIALATFMTSSTASRIRPAFMRRAPPAGVRPRAAPAARARVRRGFGLVGALRAADQAQGRDERDFHRHAAIIGGAFCVPGHELLDDAVFQRMEADHREPPAGAEPCVRGFEPGLEVGQLAVDEDADRLEAARGRMNLSPPRGTTEAIRSASCARAATAAPRRDARRSRGRCGATGVPRHRSTARRRSRARRRAPAIRPRSPDSGSMRMSSGPSFAEAEAALGHVQLRRGHAEVEQHAVEAGVGGAPAREVGEAAAMDRDAPVAAEFTAGHGDRLGILVHQQQPASRPQALQHARACPPRPNVPSR